jgi:hypothetical protein
MPYTPDAVAKDADLGLPQANPPSPTSRLDWLPYLTIALLLVVLYYRVAVKLVYDWYTIPDYSHGFLVPFFAAFLIWDKRKVLKATPIKQTWSGIALVVFAIMVLILGVYGVELFTARISFILLMTGLIATFFGWAMVRELRFPLLVLVLASPSPPFSSTGSPSRCNCWLQELPVTYCRCWACLRSTKATSSNCRS